jgi:pyruvate,water dikinase
VSEDNRAYDDGNMWFRDALHHMEVLQPFDTITFEAWGQALSAYNGRVFAVPPAHGIDQRVINGYLYVRPVGIDDPAWVDERVSHFMERAGFYFGNWDELYDAGRRRWRAASPSCATWRSRSCRGSRTRRWSPRPGASPPASSS